MRESSEGHYAGYEQVQAEDGEQHHRHKKAVDGNSEGSRNSLRIKGHPAMEVGAREDKGLSLYGMSIAHYPKHVSSSHAQNPLVILSA
jgi:hypothetical protein